MGQRFVVSATFLLGELMRPPVEVGRHLGGFVLRTPELDQSAGQVLKIWRRHRVGVRGCRNRGLADRTSGNDADTLHVLPLHRSALLAAAGHLGGRVTQFAEDVIPTGQDAKGGVFPVEK